jgi:hypothetical protein
MQLALVGKWDNKKIEQLQIKKEQENSCSFLAIMNFTTSTINYHSKINTLGESIIEQREIYNSRGNLSRRY